MSDAIPTIDREQAIKLLQLGEIHAHALGTLKIIGVAGENAPSPNEKLYFYNGGEVSSKYFRSLEKTLKFIAPDGLSKFYLEANVAKWVAREGSGEDPCPWLSEWYAYHKPAHQRAEYLSGLYTKGYGNRTTNGDKTAKWFLESFEFDSKVIEKIAGMSWQAAQDLKNVPAEAAQPAVAASKPVSEAAPAPQASPAPAVNMLTQDQAILLLRLVRTVRYRDTLQLWQYEATLGNPRRGGYFYDTTKLHSSIIAEARKGQTYSFQHKDITDSLRAKPNFRPMAVDTDFSFLGGADEIKKIIGAMDGHPVGIEIFKDPLTLATHISDTQHKRFNPSQHVWRITISEEMLAELERVAGKSADEVTMMFDWEIDGIRKRCLADLAAKAGVDAVAAPATVPANAVAGSGRGVAGKVAEMPAITRPSDPALQKPFDMLVKLCVGNVGWDNPIVTTMILKDKKMDGGSIDSDVWRRIAADCGIDGNLLVAAFDAAHTVAVEKSAFGSLVPLRDRSAVTQAIKNVFTQAGQLAVFEQLAQMGKQVITR